MMRMTLHLLFNGQAAIVRRQSKSIAELFTHGNIRHRPTQLGISGLSSSTFITPSKAGATEPSGTESLITAAYLHALVERANAIASIRPE